METIWHLRLIQTNGQGQSCAPMPRELGRCEAALIQELCSCTPAAPLPIPSVTLSSTWPVQRAACACWNRHVLGFVSWGAWSTALTVLGKAGASAAGQSANQATRFYFFSSRFQTSLEDLTMNQSYSFAEVHGTFIQFDRSVQIFLKDKKARNRSWFLTA